MTMGIRVLLLVAVGLSFFVPRAQGKCAHILLTVEGPVISDSGSGLSVVVRAIADDGSQHEAVTEVSGGQYSISLAFHTYKSFSWFGGDNCSRRPEIVEVSLLEGKEELDKVRLSFTKAFERDSTFRYRLQKPLALYAKRNLPECNPALPQQPHLKAGDLAIDARGYKRAPLVRYVIQPDGSVSDVHLVRGSGSKAVDDYVLRWMETSAYDARRGCPLIYTSVTVTVDFR